jgi:hypothetical protein
MLKYPKYNLGKELGSKEHVIMSAGQLNCKFLQ